MARVCRECGEYTPVPGGLCAVCASWAKAGIHFQNPEWPVIPVKLKPATTPREEPIPEGQFKVKGGRFSSGKGARKNVQDELF